jgi:hypothetical protein
VLADAFPDKWVQLRLGQCKLEKLYGLLTCGSSITKRLSFQHQRALDHKKTPEDNAMVRKAKELAIDAPTDEL